MGLTDLVKNPRGTSGKSVGDLGGLLLDDARLILVAARLFLEFMSLDSMSDSLALL